MGAEALCRGAAEVVGIEKSGAACRVVKENWQKVAKDEQRFQVVKGDVVRQIRADAAWLNAQAKEDRTFDLVYFDPPYAAGLYSLVLEHLAQRLAPDGEAAVEYGDGHWQPNQLSEGSDKGLEVVKEKRYGSTHLLFLRRSAN